MTAPGFKATARNGNGRFLTVRWAGIAVVLVGGVVAITLAFGRVEGRVDRNTDRGDRHAERIQAVEERQKEIADGVAEIRGDVKVLVERMKPRAPSP